jgi:hypothetical protein
MFSFTARKKTTDFQRLIRRIIDLTVPNKASSEKVSRHEDRYNRTIPALLCPWQDTAPVVHKCAKAITKDFSDRGLGLIMSQPFDATDVAIGFFLEKVMPEPWFFLGTQQSNVAIGGDFWLLGIGLKEFMNDDYRCELAPLFRMAHRLLPPTPGPEATIATAQSLVERAIELG